MLDAERQVLEHLSAGILAAEDWASGYRKAPKQHAAMIKQGAHLHALVLAHFKKVADEIPQTIDWFVYSRAVIEQKQALRASSNVQAYDVDVIVNRDVVNSQDATFIKVVFDTMANIVELGADSGEAEYGIPVSLTSTSEVIQSLTSEQIANLVGMRVDKKSGLIVPNPNPAYNIDETTRGRIVNSIKTSIRLGENQQEAADRLLKVIADPVRADMIAYTETVRAYAEGRRAYANASGALAKHWYDSNAIDICSDNTAEGWIPVLQDFVSGDPYEPAHPHCRCITTYSYDKADLIDAGINPDTGEQA